MIHRDYRKEMGLKPAVPKVPWPIAVVVLAAAGAGAWFAVTKLPPARGGHTAHDGPPVQAAPANPAAPAGE